MEVWLPIADSDRLISNLGYVKNKKGIILKPGARTRSGYIPMKLKINSIYKNTKVHILVAQAFIPNPDNKPYVNHINGIRHDNRAVNLEWVTPKENTEHKIFPNNSRSSRRVVQKTLDGNVVKIWNSITLASNTLKIDRGSITNCCSRKRNTAGGWFWMYYEDYVQHDPNEKWREIELDSRKIRVSSLGRVQLHNGLITQGSLDAGYLRFRDYRIHRLVALAFCSKENGKEYVNHIDGDTTNNKASNLEWCSPKENSRRALSLGLCNNKSRNKYQYPVKQILLMDLSRNFHP